MSAPTLIQQVAVSPEVLSSWEGFIAVAGQEKGQRWADFGWSKGKYISNFDCHWRKQIRKNLKQPDNLVSEIQKMAISESIDPKRMKGKCLDMIAPKVDAGTNWVTAAIAHKVPRAFDFIISQSETDCSKVIPISRLIDYRNDEDHWDQEFQKLWERDHEDEFNRDADSIVKAIEAALLASESLIFVDPNNGGSAEYGKLVKCAVEHRKRMGGSKLSRLEYHTGANGWKSTERVDEVDFHKRRARNISLFEKILPPGVELDLYFWAKKENGRRLHQRLILFDFGAVRVEQGLDTSDNPGEITPITLLPENTFSKALQSYCVDSQDFHLIDGPVKCVGK